MEGSESWSQSLKKLQEIIEDQLHFEQGIEAERAHRCEKNNDR